MKKIIAMSVAFGVVILVVLIGRRFQAAIGKHVPMISAEDLKKAMEETPSMLVINVLSKEAYEGCHIKGSQSIPFYNSFKKEMESCDKDRRIVVYCASVLCLLSVMAAEKLIKMGFTNVAHFKGGMKEWNVKGFPTKGTCQARYLQ